MSSTRSCGSSSSTSNSNSNSHMPARRANSSRRTSESSSSQLGTTTSTTSSSSSSSSTARQQHVADKSAVKRKKRRKDEDERVPVVLLKRLEDERKSNECKVKRVTEVKVVVERACNIESIRAAALVAGKKSTRHPVHRSSENLANGDDKATEPIRLQVELKKVVAVVIEDAVKALPKKSIESAKSSDGKSSKVKSDRKPADRSAERNVHNVNNDNSRKTIDPKITERRLLVKLDRSEVQNCLAAQKCVQRLHAEEKVVDKSETDKYHSENENQDDDVACTTSTGIKTCAITSDDGEIQNDWVEKTSVDDVTDRLKEVQKTDATDKVKKVRKPDVTNKVKKVQKPDVKNKVKEVKKTDVTDKVKEVQKADVEKPPVESAVKKRGRPRKNKNVEEPTKSVVKNQRLSSSRKKRKAKSQDDAHKSIKANSDKDLADDTKIHKDSSVQVNKNQTERLNESPKDTSCESTKSSLSSESLNESAVVDSEQVSSETSETDKVSNKIIESNSGSDNDSSVVAAAKPVPLPMEVDEISHERTVVGDSKAESESAQRICDIRSKNVDEDAETLPEEAETVDKSTEEVLSETSTENLVEGENSESPLENSVSSDITECPTKSSEENETCESQAKKLQASETSENLVNGEVESPADSFVSCENAESTNEESINGENNEMIETLEDTESIASTCTLIEETPEELSRELDDAQEELPEDVEKQTEEPAEEDAHKDPESIKELPEVATEKEDDAASETSLKTDKLDESFSSDDKANETNEHESTFENNLKSVENLVIDSILNGEIVSPKMIVPSVASRVEQSFVFEGGVEEFVADIEASKAVSLESSTPVEKVPSLVDNPKPSPVVEAAPVAETVAPSVPIEEPALVESSVPLEEPAETLPVEPLPSVEQQEPATEEETLESPPVTEEVTTEATSEPAAPTEEPPVDEEFAKHRRKDAISELENVGGREALEEACNDVNAEREEEQQPPPPSTFGVENNSDVNDFQVPSSELVSSDCYPELTAVGSDNYLENVSDADSEICLADRLNQLADLKIPSLEETLPSEKLSDIEESSPSDHTKRQRILMKITKTDANEHVTHLVESKEDEETALPSSNDQFAADQVTEGEIKIIMRKESSSNNHVIKEIKIIPRTPEGSNSARIPGYSPTSSDLSSGNSSCRVPSCSPAKPDSGSYRMPGWSPASTETGQTSTTATTKKKQARPKKYPIFTDAELIAKTTAIVNNVDVHVASKLANKPLFEPVESIRINEDDEVEQNDDDEEEQQSVITEQTYVSGSQLLEAMPAQPEIAAELTRKIEEDQSAAKKKKKKMGRPRKYPLPDEDVGTKSENVSVARVEFNVVDSIEEFVEPAKQIPSRPVSPVKKRGRPRKYPVESAETSGVEEGDSIVESVLIHEAPSDKKARNANSSMTENAERKSRKPFKTLKDLLENSPEIQPADDVDSQTEDEAPVVEPNVERRGRKPWKHLKDLKRAADQENSTTENEVASDASPTKPYVERRGRKPWKHLKELNKLSESQVAENSMTENEAASNASPVKPYVERRGRKPWKHLKEANALAENQIADDADSQTEDEAPVAAPYVERRGRKPWKHLKNLEKSAENQVAENADSQTEDETPVVAPYVERRGRKPWKHLKNLDKSLESQIAQQDMSTTENDAVSDASLTKFERRGRRPIHLKNLDKPAENQLAEDADSQTEDGTPVAAPYVERRGRKPWKHLKNLDKSAENQVAEDAGSQTEDEAPVAAPYVERRGHKPKHLKDPNKSTENQADEGADSQTEDEASVAAPYVERRGRKPWKHFKGLDKSSNNQVAGDADSQTEDEAPVAAPYVERRGRKPWKHLKNLDKSAENQVAENADSQTEDETSVAAPYTEKRGHKPWKHLKNLDKSAEYQVAENADSQTEDEAPVAAPYVDRRGRKPWKHLKNLDKSAENQVAEDAGSQTEDEAPVAAPYVERRGHKPKHLKDPNKSTENQADEGADSQTEDEASVAAPYVKRRGRKPWKHLKNLDKSSDNQVAGDADSQTEDEAPDAAPYVERRGRKPWKHLKNFEKSAENQVAENADSQTEDETPVAAPYVERRGRKPWKHLKHANESSVNQVPQQENPTTENNVSPTKVERRGRKPWKHLKNLDKSTENQVAEDADSQTEDETIQDNLETEQTVKKRRRCKSQKLAELLAAEGATSMTEDESADDAPSIEKDDSAVLPAEKTSSVTENESVDGTIEAKPYVERRDRKPKHLKDPNKSTENQADEGADSQTEDEAPVAAPYVERRGCKPSKHLKNLDNSSESHAIEQDMSATETDAVSDAFLIKIERKARPRKDRNVNLPNEKRKRGRPRVHPRYSENQAAEKTNSQTLQDVQNAEEAGSINEDEPVNDDGAVEPLVQEKEAASELTQDDETAISENVVTEESASNTENEISSDTPLAEVIIKRKRGRKPLKDSEDTTITSVAEEAMTEDESADEDALIGEQAVVADKFAVISSPEEKKRGRRLKTQPEAEVLLPENQATEEASSMTDVPAVEPIVKKRGRQRKYSQDEAIPEIPAVAQDASPVTEDETVSSTEDIPTSDNLVQKLVKSVPPIKIAKNQVLEQPSSQTEDETVSSTEDIPSGEQHPQPIVKKVKFAELPHMNDSGSTPFGSSVEDSMSAMEPPVAVKKRRRPPKIARQADSTNDSVDNTTEDETVSSTEDIPVGEQHVIKKKQGRSKKNIPLSSFELDTMKNSLAASSVEDLSTFELVAPKKRGRKPHPRPLDGDENNSMAASSMEDLSTVVPPLVVKKKRGRKPRALVQNDSTCSDSIAASSMEDLSRLARSPMLVKKRGRPPKIPRLPIAGYMSAVSMEDFSPMKLLSPAKQKQLEKFAASFGHSIFDTNQQVAHDRSLSPVKKRGRPPKYPRENIEAPKRVSIVENPGVIFAPTIEQQPPVLEKRKGRLPRRLSQDENFLPGILRSDKMMGRRASHDSGIIPAFSLSDGGETMPSLGKRQGRPPRKFSPDEEHSFSALPQPIVNHVQMENESPKKLGRTPIRKDDGLPMSQSPISDSDDTSSGVPKRRGRRPKKFALEDGFTSSRETSPTKKRGRPPKSLQVLSLPLPQPETKEPPQDVSLPPVAPCVLSCSDEVKKTPTISTTNLLRQQRKPKMAQPQPVAPPVIVQPVPQLNEQPPPPLPSPVKKRGRPKLLPIFDIGAKLRPEELPDGLTIEQLRRRRHSQDDSMFTTVVMPPMLAARPKEFEDAQSRKKRGRPPKVRELPQPFVLRPVKPVEKVPEVAAPVASIEDSPKLKERLNRPPKASPEKSVPPVQETTTKLTAADFLRTWTDRDDSPAPQTTQQPTKKPGARQRRFSQDFTLDESSRPSSRNRLRRYSQGDALDDTSNDELRFNARKRMRSSGSDSSIVQDEKRPRVERDLCDQHSITKELVVQLTKIDKGEESPTAPCQQPQQLPISSDLVRMNLRRKLESNNHSGLEPPPLVPIEPSRLQPPTHSDAKLLMLMQPSEDKTVLQSAAAQPIQPPTQQFCIIFIPDALTSSESSLSKDSQPTATIVNFQPVPDSELANKSVIYTPTTPTKIFVNSSVEEQQRHRSFLCTTCTQALDLVGRLEANMGMTEEDKCAIKCPFCSNDFQSVFYLEYHLRQEHLKCENERQCRHPGFNTLRIPSHDAAASESEIYITFALKCRSCYELFDGVHSLNEHVRAKHANLIRLHKPAPLASGMICYPPPPPPSSTSSPFKNGARPELLHCPSDCICRIGIRSTDSPMQRAQMLKRCPNFMRRLEKIEAAAYEVYTCTLCKSTFLMKDEVVEHLMKMHEVACKFPCTKCLASFRSVQLQEAHHCSETTIRDLDKLLNIVIMPTDKAHDASKFEDSSNDELGPMKTTPPPAVPSASTPLNGLKRKNGVVIQRLTRFLAMQPPKKPRFEPSAPATSKKRQKTPCPKCQKKFAYRKSLNDHIIFEHIIPCKADEASKNMAVELLRLINNGATDQSKIEELATALGKYTDDEGTSLKKLTLMDEQENWNESQHDGERDMMQCVKCKVGFRVPNTANLTRRNNHQRTQSPIPQLCDRCDPTRRRRNNAVNNGHKYSNAKSAVNGSQIRYTYECIQCGESFPTTIELNSHKSREHSARPSDAALKCDSCSKIFYSSRMLEKHKKLQHDAFTSHDHDNNSSRAEYDDDESMNGSLNNQSSAMDTSKDSEAAMNDTANSSTTSRRDSSDGNNKDEEEACKCPRCDFSAEKVSLKNHLKREHGIMAFICQFCGKLLVEISEVRHMLDYHIKSSRKNGGVAATLRCGGDEVSELLRTLGKKRLQSLMIYHDFEGKCNNAIMRCPICPEQFATRESCRHHYQWMHDCTCILCDASFGGGNLAGQHKVAVHNSIASYVWAIQRLVSAIVHGLRLDRAHPSNVLYQEVSMRLDALEQQEVIESEMLAASRASSKTCEENVVVVPEPFLEPVVLSEDQLPGSGNMIEVVIGNDMVVEDSEDNLLENFYLSPNYESSCEQPRILDAGALIPELEEEEEVVTTIAPIVNTCASIAIPTTPSITTSNGGILIPTTPVTAETYATSAVFKLRQDNGQEEVVLAITDEDLVTYRDDFGSLAEKLSATCDSLSLEEITTMLRSYFENVGTPQTEEVQVEQFAIEPRTQ